MTWLTAVQRALFATLLVGVVLAPGPTDATVVSADDDVSYVNPRYDDAATLAVEGTLEAIADTVPGTDEYVYSVRTDDGDAIGVPTSFAEDAPVGGRFEGELALTADVADDVRDEGVTVAAGKTIDGDSAAGQTVMAVLAEQEAPAPVASATVTEPVAAAVTPSAHHAYVAIINNRGSLPSRTTIQARVAAIRSFWKSESGGVITAFDQPKTVEYKSSAASTTSCGLSGSNWNAVWNEASTKFPSVSFSSESRNHLIVLVSSSCNYGGSVGIGTVGSSIGSGGYSIVQIGGSGQHIGAHEVGHNFGLGHANLQFCSAACQVENYGGIYSVMGYTVGTFSAPSLDTASREALDLPDTSEEISSVVPKTVFKHLAARSAESGLRGLKIVDPGTGGEYFVDYRSGTGRDAQAAYTSGIRLGGSIVYAPGIVVTQRSSNLGSSFETDVLTRHIGADYLSSVAEGDSFSSSSDQLHIVPCWQNGSGGADIAITFGAAAPDPTVVLDPSADPTMTFGADPRPQSGRAATAEEGAWAAGTAFKYQWRANGVAIAGATGRTYVVAGTNYNKDLTVTVTGRKCEFLSVSRTSSAAAVAIGTLSTSTPKISGTAKVGRTLTASPRTWTSGTAFRYRWLANGKPITSFSTKRTYKISKKMKGKYITAQVNGRKIGYTSVTKTSAKTKKVKK